MKYFYLLLITAIITTACVSKKSLEEAQANSDQASLHLAKCGEDLNNTIGEMNEIEARYETAKATIDQQQAQIATQQSELAQYDGITQQLQMTSDSLSYHRAATVRLEDRIHDQDGQISMMHDGLTSIETELARAGYMTYAQGDPLWTSDAAALDQLVNGVRNSFVLLDRVPSDPDTVSSYHYTTGNMGIYCPPSMIHKRSYDVVSIVADLLSDDDLRQHLIDRVQDHNPDLTEEDLEDREVLIDTISFYQLIELDLRNAVEGAFEINPVHGDPRQKMRRGMEGWHWKVTPNSEERVQQLLLHTTIYNPDGSVDRTRSKSYTININVDISNFWHKLKLLITEDPAWAMTTLIIPFLTFLWGQYIGKKKKKISA